MKMAQAESRRRKAPRSFTARPQGDGKRQFYPSLDPWGETPEGAVSLQTANVLAERFPVHLHRYTSGTEISCVQGNTDCSKRQLYKCTISDEKYLTYC